MRYNIAFQGKGISKTLLKLRSLAPIYRHFEEGDWTHFWLESQLEFNQIEEIITSAHDLYFIEDERKKRVSSPGFPKLVMERYITCSLWSALKAPMPEGLGFPCEKAKDDLGRYFRSFFSTVSRFEWPIFICNKDKFDVLNEAEGSRSTLVKASVKQISDGAKRILEDLGLPSYDTSVWFQLKILEAYPENLPSPVNLKTGSPAQADYITVLASIQSSSPITLSNCTSFKRDLEFLFKSWTMSVDVRYYEDECGKGGLNYLCLSSGEGSPPLTAAEMWLRLKQILTKSKILADELQVWKWDNKFYKEWD